MVSGGSLRRCLIMSTSPILTLTLPSMSEMLWKAPVDWLSMIVTSLGELIRALLKFEPINPKPPVTTHDKIIQTSRIYKVALTFIGICQWLDLRLWNISLTGLSRKPEWDHTFVGLKSDTWISAIPVMMLSLGYAGSGVSVKLISTLSPQAKVILVDISW